MTITFHDLSHDVITHRFAVGEELSGRVSYEAKSTSRWKRLGLYLKGEEKDNDAEDLVRQEVWISVVKGEMVTLDFTIVPNPMPAFNGNSSVKIAGLMAIAEPASDSGNQTVVQVLQIANAPVRHAIIAEKRSRLEVATIGCWHYIYLFLTVSLTLTGLADQSFLLLAGLSWTIYFLIRNRQNAIRQKIGAVYATTEQLSPERLDVYLNFPNGSIEAEKVKAFYEVVEQRVTFYDDDYPNRTNYPQFQSAKVVGQAHGLGCKLSFQLPGNLPFPMETQQAKLFWQLRVRIAQPGFGSQYYHGAFEVSPAGYVS